MILFRFLARLILMLALVDIGLGLWVWLAGFDVTKAAGETWFAIDSESLNLVQAVVQRYTHPALWDTIAVPLLLRPFWEAVLLAFIGLLVIGGLFGLASRRGR